MCGARRGEGVSYLGCSTDFNIRVFKPRTSKPVRGEASHLIYSVSRTRSRMEADVDIRKAKAVQQRKTFIVLRDGAIA